MNNAQRTTRYALCAFRYLPTYIHSHEIVITKTDNNIANNTEWLKCPSAYITETLWCTEEWRWFLGSKLDAEVNCKLQPFYHWESTKPQVLSVQKTRWEPNFVAKWKIAVPSRKGSLVLQPWLDIKDTKQTYKTKLYGLSPRANYTDRATAASRRSGCQLLRIKGATWSAWRILTAVFSVF
jgi:hypothetical protein